MIPGHKRENALKLSAALVTKPRPRKKTVNVARVNVGPTKNMELLLLPIQAKKPRAKAANENVALNNNPELRPA